MAIEDIGPGETGWTLAADKILKPANAARAVEILLNAIAQARDEGEKIPDWLDEAEDAAVDALRSGDVAWPSTGTPASRPSGKPDEGVSLEEQIRRIEGRALEQGWQIAETFVERGISGSVPLGDQPEGSRLMATLQPGDVVIAAKLDRMFRSAWNALNVIREFQRRQISLWLLDLGGDVSGDGIAKLVLTILAAIAAFERERIGERIRDAKRHQRRTGQFLGGDRPFGWQIGEDGVLVKDENEQRALAEMRDLRAAGDSYRSIAAHMKTKGFLISHQGVKRALARVPS
jgi:putative DNA-invertase from lambdoid prophage Rac